ncbi:DUF7793 family protein [Pontibacter sp. H249]|uniref:DUF7793 family protein n=1 Tax=Pontibacter sp. H249 TaxID=3133420 RepID=UPI0030C3520E
MANSEKNTRTKLTEYLELFMEDGILYCIYKDVELVDLAIAKKCVQDRLNFIGQETYPSFFDITRIKQSTKDARDYLANEGNDLVSASAILVGSPMLKMSANFFIMVNKPQNPTRLFTDRKSALEWLEKYKK